MTGIIRIETTETNGDALLDRRRFVRRLGTGAPPRRWSRGTRAGRARHHRRRRPSAPGFARTAAPSR